MLSTNSEMSKTKLWIVTELFYPDQTSTAYILSKIANKMSERYDVNVITTDSLYQENISNSDKYFNLDESISVIRVKSKRLNKNSLIQRFIRLFTQSNSLFRELKNRVSSNEKVLIVTNPAPLIVKCAKLKKRRNFYLNILVHDVFPENTIPAGIIQSKESLLFKIISKRYDKAYAAADKLIVLGRDMKDVVEQKIVRSKHIPEVVIIENWGDVDNIKPKESHQKEYITIQYAGNIGRVQGLESFINLLEKSANKKLVLDLWGDGAMTDNLKNIVSDKALNDQVNFHGSFSREEQNDILNSANIALVTLAEGMYGLGVPSKTYNILAAGKPVLYIGDLNSEIALMVKEESVGYCFSQDDKEGIINFLNELQLGLLPELEEMGKRARRLAENKYSEDAILDKFLNTI
jgi:glycosyltransferase involved in cell wall biosynthesis